MTRPKRNVTKNGWIIVAVLTTCIALVSFFLHIERSNLDGYLGMSLPAGFKIFNENSPWNTPICENAETDPNSDLMIQNLIESLVSLGRTPNLGINYKEWTSPIHVIDADKSPKVDVRTTDPLGQLYESVDPDHDGIAEDIPLPDGCWPDPSNDGHMILVDPYKRVCWEFSIAHKLGPGKWEASIIDKWDLNGPGYREPFSGKYWWRSGARGSGCPFIAGLIRPEEIEAGEINHALAIATPINRKKISDEAKWEYELCSPPASRTDGSGIGPEYVPEGARLQLNPNLDLDALGISEDAKTVARAMQQYGIFVVDCGAGFSLYFQNLGPDGGKWQEHPGLADITKIPVSELRVLKCNIVVKE